MYWTLPLRGYQRSLAISMKHKALTVCAQSPMAGILAIFRKNVLFLELYHWGLGLNMVLSCLCSCFNEQIDRTAMRFYSCYLVLETPTALLPFWLFFFLIKFLLLMSSQVWRTTAQLVNQNGWGKLEPALCLSDLRILCSCSLQQLPSLCPHLCSPNCGWCVGP